MTGAARRHSLLLRIVLAIPLVLVPAVAYLLLTTGSSAGPALARGVQDGTFHPVAGAFEPDGTDPAECGGDYRCLEQGFGNLAYALGPKAALARFEAAIVADEHVSADCHRISHWIGSAALARFRGNVARTFAAGGPSCSSGYYHGILERAFAGVTSKEELAELAGSLCVDQGLRRRGFLDRQCRHGLGHGLMIQTGYALPTALELCGRLETGWDRKTCANGVFMENVNTSFGFRSPWLDDKDPLYPCQTVSPANRGPCYLRTATRILVAGGYDFAAAAQTCSTVDRRWRAQCFRGLGRDSVDAKYAPETARSRCRATRGGEPDCIYGAARTVFDRWGLLGATGVLAFCRDARAAVQSRCYAAIGGVVGLQHASARARRAACARLAPRYAGSCARAAEAEVEPSGVEAWG